jgi:ABC-type transport system involved in multi-copper enzyme maturation permease subunit
MSGGPWTLWRRQAWVVARHEVSRSLFSRRALAVYLLAAMPIALAALRAVFLPEKLRLDAAHPTTDFAQMFQFFILRFVVFFANAVIFVRLFRGEILERSLHYSLLAPIRRDVLVAGKYVGGLLSSALILVPTTAATFLLMYAAHLQLGAGTVYNSATLGHLAWYLVVVVLACVGYGALFMLAGLYFRNPMVPAILFLGWEVLTPFLPPFLKAISVVHYLNSLVPVPPKLGPLALLSQPVAPWIAVFGIAVVTAVSLLLCTRTAQRLEVTYATE